MLLRLFDGHPRLFAMPTETGIITILEKRPAFIEELRKINNPTQLLCFLSQNSILRFQDIINASIKGMSFSSNNIFYPFEFDFNLFGESFFKYIQKESDVREIINGYHCSIKEAWINYKTQSTPEAGYVVQRAHRINMYPGEDSIRFVMDNMEDMEVLEIVRHPVWQINSAIRNSGEHLEESVVAWAFAASEIFNKKKKYKDRYHVVKYEDLVTDVEKAMNNAAYSVGLERNPILYTPTFNGEAWKGNSLFGAKEDLKMTNQMSLSETQNRYIQKSLCHYMRGLGYEKL